MKVSVLKAHPYAGQPRAVGETYECEEKFVETLVTLGLVKPESYAPPVEAGTEDKDKRYQRRDMRPKK